MGRLLIEKPESRTLVDGWRQQPEMLGVRLTFHRGQSRSWLTDGTADWFRTAAEHAGVPVEDKAWIMGRGIGEWLGWPLPRN
jgi:hypothetical protein